MKVCCLWSEFLFLNKLEIKICGFQFKDIVHKHTNHISDVDFDVIKEKWQQPSIISFAPFSSVALVCSRMLKGHSKC